MHYTRFPKWKLKCENILECELAALPECQHTERLSIGLATLEWISMYPRGYPKTK